MAREEYGVTWWGEQWLQALTKIDNANRIPRGKTYARNGSVSSLEISKNNIIGKVRGSRPKPYTVTLSMKEISKAEHDKILSKMESYPSVISKLQNGKIDPQLLAVCNEENIMIFPAKASDMNMRCSCPDYAVPCKHIAAVIYKVCNEIDNDPFVLFRFRNLDLLKNIGKLAIDKNQTIPDQSKFFKSHFKNEVHELYDPLLIDYSKLPNKQKEIIELLEAQPPFYSRGDFKKNYQDILLKIAKEAYYTINEQFPVDESDTKGRINKVNFENKLHWKWKNHTIDQSGFTIETVLNLTSYELNLLDQNIRGAQEWVIFALHLISKGLIYPKILKDKDTYFMYWCPLILDEGIKKIISTSHLPFSIHVDKHPTNTFLTLTFLITAFISSFSSNIKKDSDEITEFFFRHKKNKFNGPAEQGLPKSIAQWVRIFEWDMGQTVPVIMVNEEKDNHFSVDVKVKNYTKDNRKLVTYADFIKKKKPEELVQLYKDFDLLSNYISGISNYINSKGSMAISYHGESFIDFLFKIKPLMGLLGIETILPKSLHRLLKPKASVRIGAKSSTLKSGILNFAGLLDFDWRVSIGGDLISVDEFNTLVKKAGQLIKFKGEYIYISENELTALQKRLSRRDNLSSIDVLHAALSQEIEGEPIVLDDRAKEIIRELKNIDIIDPPKSLTASMRPYQLKGYSWMIKNAKIGVGSIIADDMGLGKTLQVIAFITYLKEQGFLHNKNVLIVVPTSLIPNWEAEFKKFSPLITVETIYGQSNNTINLKKESRVVLTSYGQLRSKSENFMKIKWELVVIDEAQAIKNPGSQQTKAIKGLKANLHLAMSGTPVENGLLDYWSVMDFVNKNLLGNKTYFSKTFDTPISKERNEEALHKFKKITEPFIMRRMKTDKNIISDLPDKLIQDTYTVLSKEQAAIYSQVVRECLQLIENEKMDDHKSVFKRQGLILQMILSLKQICNHPSQWTKEKNYNPALSGKSEMLIDLVGSILEADDKVLIFTQFKEMGDILEHVIKQHFGISALWLHGGVQLKDRKKMVDEFQTLSHKKVMILSLKAGGTGLNLTAANHVIHYDLWWNPAVEAQATDRAFRIGQKKNVIVHRFITQNTFEEKINDLINSKRDLAQLTVTSGEKWIGELNNKEIRDLFVSK